MTASLEAMSLPYKKARGKCAACGSEGSVLDDGRPQAHWIWGAGKPIRCLGMQMQAVEVIKPEGYLGYEPKPLPQMQVLK